MRVKAFDRTSDSLGMFRCLEVGGVNFVNAIEAVAVRLIDAACRGRIAW